MKGSEWKMINLLFVVTVIFTGMAYAADFRCPVRVIQGIELVERNPVIAEVVKKRPERVYHVLVNNQVSSSWVGVRLYDVEHEERGETSCVYHKASSYVGKMLGPQESFCIGYAIDCSGKGNENKLLRILSLDSDDGGRLGHFDFYPNGQRRESLMLRNGKFVDIVFESSKLADGTNLYTVTLTERDGRLR